MNVNESRHVPTESATSQSTGATAVDALNTRSVSRETTGDRRTIDPALSQLRTSQRDVGRGGALVRGKISHARQSSQPAQAPQYRYAERSLPGGLPDELWEVILKMSGVFHETDPLDTEHYKPESLRLLLDLRLTSQGLNRLTQPTHNALVLADGIIKGHAGPSVLSRLDDFARRDIRRLDIPTAAYLQLGLRRLAAQPCEDVADASVVTTDDRNRKRFLSKAVKWLTHPLHAPSPVAGESSTSAAVQPREAVLRLDDLSRDGAYRQRLEALRLAEIDQLWPILEKAWPGSKGGNTPKEWTRPLVALCRLDLLEERSNSLLIDKVWPMVATLSVASRSEPLAALLMRRSLPAPIRNDAMRLLKEGHDTNCTSRFHAEGLGALAIYLRQAPLEQRLHTLHELLAPDGPLFDLPSQHLALALVPLANVNIGEAPDAEKQSLFGRVQALRQRLPESSEMYRLLPHHVDDPYHMLFRMRRVQHGKFDSESPEDHMVWEFMDHVGQPGHIPFTLDLIALMDGPARSVDEPLSLNDFRQMISIGKVAYQAQAPFNFIHFLRHQAAVLGCLKPEDCLEGVRAILEMHHTDVTDSTAILPLLSTLIGETDRNGKMPPESWWLPLLRVPQNHLPALLGLLEREIDFPETYNPRKLIADMERVLRHRSDIKAIRPQAQRLLEDLFVRHPYLIVDSLSENPKFQLEPLSKFWQRPVK